MKFFSSAETPWNRYLGEEKTNTDTYQKIHTVELSRARDQWLNVRGKITSRTIRM